MLITSLTEQENLPEEGTLVPVEEVMSSTLNVEKNESTKIGNTKAAVETFYSDTPILAKIAYCESRYRHTDKDGNIHRGKVNPKDVGVMQINEDYHLEKSQELGFDIYTFRGNLAYAKYLYNRQGVLPWMHSSKCWG